MRPLELGSLVGLALALLALALRAGPVRRRRGLFGASAGVMGLQAALEGARWQLAIAYLAAAVGLALAFRRRLAPQAGGVGPIARAARVLLAAIVVAAAALLPALLPVPSFPPPEGPHPVGTVTFLLTDPARDDEGAPGQRRRLVVQAWYPAAASAAGGPRAPYLPDVARTGPGLSRAFGLPPFFASHLALASSHAHEGAPFAPAIERAPLLVVSHGHRLFRHASTTTSEALASLGYAVVAIDHTGDAAAVAFPDGVALTRAPAPSGLTEEEEARSKAHWVGVRAADVRFVLDVLAGAAGATIPAVIAGRIDAARAGLLGHSLGGATAAEVCRTDARALACADLDGRIYGEAQTAGVAQPFLLVESEARGHDLDAFVARLRGPSCRVRVARALHTDFSDMPFLLPALPLLLGVGQRGDETLRETDRTVAAFFDATLRGDPAGWSRVRSAHPRFSTTCERLPPP
jgi:predicted dienelactone hydrolase